MDTLLDKTGVVAHKAEEFDQETKEIIYEIGFVVTLGTEAVPSDTYVTVSLQTNDLKLFKSFETGKNYSLKFLEKHADKLKVVGMEN